MVRSNLPWGIFAILLAAGPAASVPSVSVSMKAAFPSPPYLVELIETAAGENSTAYFPLLDRVASGYFAPATTEQELYTKFLQVLVEDGHIVQPDALSTFKLALSMRTAAPRIEAHYQYYATGVEPKLGPKPPAGCDVWVSYKASYYCDAALDEPRELALEDDQARDLPFDRLLGGPGPEAILYADLSSPSFGAFHNSLVEKARRGDISYRVRYRRAAEVDVENHALPVSGYGVELALKKTDYIVIDDREAEAGDTGDHAGGSQVVLEEEEEVADLKPLSKAEVASLGVKAASLIAQSDRPFETLIKLTQDFPKFSAWIAGHDAPTEFVTEQQENLDQMIPSGINVLWMNGVQVVERQIDPFSLVDMLRRERKLIEEVRDIGLTGRQAISLLSHTALTSAKSDDSGQRFDWRDQNEGGDVIMWLNDLENDSQYEDFPKSLKALLHRTYPGQVPPVRRNVFNVVVPFDVTKPLDLKAALQLATFVQRQLPVRFGIVPMSSGAPSLDIAKVLYYLQDNHGLEGLSTYLELAMNEGSASADKTIFEEAVAARPRPDGAKPLKFEEVLESEDLGDRLKRVDRWVGRLKADSAVSPVFVNGFVVPRVDNWLQGMGAKINADLQQLRQAVHSGEMADDADVISSYTESAVHSRNVLIYADEEKDLQLLDVGKLYRENAALLEKVPTWEASPKSAKETWAALTLIADLGSVDGLSLLNSALTFRSSRPGIRLDIVHNPAGGADASALNGAVKEVIEEAQKADWVAPIGHLLAVSAADTPAGKEYDAALAAFLASVKIQPGSNALVLNGRVVGPVEEASLSFRDEEFLQLLEFEQKHRILPVYSALTDLKLDHILSGPLAAARLTSIAALSSVSDVPEGIFDSPPPLRTAIFSEWKSEHTAIEVGDAETASVHIVGLLNPASEQGQRWAPILKVLSDLDGVYVKLFMNPPEKIEELPIKRFYRYVLSSEPSFDESGAVEKLGATFRGLPSEALLTVGMDVPPAWLVGAKESVHDPDNIKLSLVKGNVEAVYELRNILIEGHSRMTNKESPPRGAQLVLGTEKEPHAADTIIMANLGYFQFKANPGYYNIQLKEGRSSDIFEIESVGAYGYDAVPGDEGTEVVLMDFKGTTLYPRMKRRPGMELEDVLSEETDQAQVDTDSLLSRGLKAAAGIWGSAEDKPSEAAPAEENAEINIFSVASGHLYERMLKIMMVSVMEHTNHTVKFWFIEQFLSPSFKDSIPALAKEYGFRYEMVTYKWPHWLRQQKEKQREIWGYKILFLDVLFPLSLDKVIFVDADQIVRADMKELVDLDLEGAPYGFTPMCDSRTEMEGFRFWKQGYWGNYLRGKPYHISALYVVDLRRFREMAAGDRLRQQYHALSADPNSLANLDQDLPNHMQFTIPIHSLPQEWLWCETWCSDESLAAAKTIDLCNNPMTKEPKLDRARRQVPEWTVYDDRVAAVEGRSKGSGAGVADVQAQEQVREKEESERKGGATAGEGEGDQEEVVQKNTKSRTWEEKPTNREKDEL